ncbi:hypothetical protein ACFQ7F_08365 [Streptomyces sp. NPDC056486]|uniref:hypothetical protein n=1 Tax=Streptomyces sp. NPDC056486 TaxID=3345835 RepID=UPI0036C8D0F9
MRLLAHRPDARRSLAVLLYEGDVGWPDAYRHRPGHEDDPYERERREREWSERERYDRTGGGPRSSWPPPPTLSPPPPLPPAMLAVRDSLTRWPDSFFRTEPGRVVALDTAFPDSSYRLHEAVRDTSELLLVHYAGVLDTGVLDADDPRDRASGRGGLPFVSLFDLIEPAPARHIVVVLEPDRSDQVPPVAEFRRRYEHLMRRYRGHLTLIVANPARWSPRPFLADALGTGSPLSVRTLAAHPRAQVLLRAYGRDVLLSGNGS